MNNCDQNLDTFNECINQTFVDNSFVDNSQIITNHYAEDGSFVYMPSSYVNSVSKPSVYNNSSFDVIIGVVIVLLCLMWLVIK